MIGDTTQVMQTGFTATSPKVSPAQDLDEKRHNLTDSATSSRTEKDIQPEEILDQIKALTEDGNFSVRFERNDEIDKLVVKVVDRQTDEVVRQFPTEDLLDTLGMLSDLRGNIVDTTI